MMITIALIFCPLLSVFLRGDCVPQSDNKGVTIGVDVAKRGQHDSMKVLEEQTRKHILDPYPFSNISQPTHELTVEEQLALSPNAIHIGRSAMDLTHPKVTSKVDENEKGRGYIEGQSKLCDYLLDASLGVDDSIDLMGVRLYDLIARAECDWGACRLCQARMNHVFRYCVLRGKDDPGLRGLCEHSDPRVQTQRLHQVGN